MQTCVSIPSSIRTITVGSGFEPDLLTLILGLSARGLIAVANHRRWGLSPRPEVVLIVHKNTILSKVVVNYVFLSAVNFILRIRC